MHILDLLQGHSQKLCNVEVHQEKVGKFRDNFYLVEK